jgi:hypothetical protein
MDELLSERYGNELDGVLSCYDRIVITGSLQSFCYAQGMTHYLYQQGIRIFEYAKFAEPLRECIRENAEALAQANGVKIEFIRKKDFRKENRVQQILKKRGDQPGLVHIPSTSSGQALAQWRRVPRIVRGTIKRLARRI